MAGCLGAHPTEIVFTSGGTEANNLALLGAPSRPGRAAAGDRGHRTPVSDGRDRAAAGAVDVLAVDRDGRLQTSGLDVITERTALVSTMLVNNETGQAQPLEQVLAAARAADAWTHTDAVQAFGLPLDFADLGVDAMTVTAHKLGGPVGIGALVVRRDLALAARFRRRAGTQSVRAPPWWHWRWPCRGSAGSSR